VYRGRRNCGTYVHIKKRLAQLGRRNLIIHVHRDTQRVTLCARLDKLPRVCFLPTLTSQSFVTNPNPNPNPKAPDPVSP
jgi:hypothetical protein